MAIVHLSVDTEVPNSHSDNNLIMLLNGLVQDYCNSIANALELQ